MWLLLTLEENFETLRHEVRDEIRGVKLDIREARLEAREQYNRFRLLIWLPVVTGALQILAVILHR
jgi:hypothetical protein